MVPSLASGLGMVLRMVPSLASGLALGVELPAGGSLTGWSSALWSLFQRVSSLL